MFVNGAGSDLSLPEIANSLRFDGVDDYAIRSFSAGTSCEYKHTYSVWVKRSKLGVGDQMLLSVFPGSGYAAYLAFSAADTLILSVTDNSSTTLNQVSTAVFRDTSAWLHVQMAFDTQNASQTLRLRIWVNNQLVLNPTLASSPRSMIGLAGYSWQIGSYIGSYLFNGNMANACFVAGQSLTPSSFAYTDPNGQWRSLSKAALTAVVNGGGNLSWFLPFDNGSSTATLGNDAGTNALNWTLTNMVRDGSAGDCWSYDTPTNSYAVLNVLAPSASGITDGALASSTTAVQADFDALAMDSYWEVTAGGSAVTAGVISSAGSANTTTVTASKVFGFRLTAAGALDYKNITDAGSWTSIATGLTGQRFPYGTGAAATWNFGQVPVTGGAFDAAAGGYFKSAPPAGYRALCTKNLPAGSITMSGTFTGNTAADGPCVFLNGVPTGLTINGNAVTFGTHADKLANGFKVRTASTSFNLSGSNTFTVTSSGDKFKYANAQVNP